MPGLVAEHPRLSFLQSVKQDVDGRDKPGHDELRGPAILDSVMPGFMPGIHVLGCIRTQEVDARDKPGHDD